MNLDAILETLREVAACELEVRRVPVDDVLVTLPAAALRAAVEALIESFDLRHLSTITGLDSGEAIELLYHFWDGQGLTLRVVLPREGTRVDTLLDLVPGADFYEREVAEMLHVAFVAPPGEKGACGEVLDREKLLLPDDWDEGAPLRCDFTSPPAVEPPQGGEPWPA
jgi:NADH:ubiquinone oxidoreductase subunit C